MFLASPGVSTLVVHCEAPGPGQVGQWLRSYGPTHVQPAEGPAPRVWRAQFERVPAQWSPLFQIGKARFVRLTPTGLVSLFIDEDDEELKTLVRVLEEAAPEIPPHPRKESFPAAMTHRQVDVLSLAVALGYYEIPHRVSQRQLAHRTGMSLSGVSALLRRAEAAAITASIDADMRAGMADAAFSIEREEDGEAATTGVRAGAALTSGPHLARPIKKRGR